jgi:hypothetical protein
MHGGDHLAQNLVAQKPNKLNQLVAALRKLLIFRSKAVSVTDSVPQWNEKPGSRMQTLFGFRLLVMLFAVTRARIVLTLPRAPSKLSAPLLKTECFV